MGGVLRARQGGGPADRRPLLLHPARGERAEPLLPQGHPGAAGGRHLTAADLGRADRAARGGHGADRAPVDRHPGRHGVGRRHVVRGIPADRRRHGQHVLRRGNRAMDAGERRPLRDLRPLRRAHRGRAAARPGSAQPEPLGADEVRAVRGGNSPGRGTRHLGLAVRLGPGGVGADRGRPEQGRDVGLSGAGAGHRAVLDQWRRVRLRRQRRDGARRGRGRARDVAEHGQRGRRAARGHRCRGTASGDRGHRAVHERADPARRGAEGQHEHPRPFGDGADQVSQAVQSATEGILLGDSDGEQAAASFAEDAAELLGESLVAQ